MSSNDGLIRLRYPATCRSCSSALAAGDRAHWDRKAKEATCATCFTATVVEPARVEIDRGRAGASARREWLRRREQREQRVRANHKHFSGLVLALTSEPQSTTSWAEGALGEEAIGRSLDRLRGEGIAVLHDRRIPGTRANIDHLVISSAGIFIVDPKNYDGRVELRDVGGWFRSEPRLYVNGRNRSKLVAGAQRQRAAVTAALGGTPWTAVPVIPTLCFIGVDNWPLLAFKPIRFNDVYVLWGKALGKLVRGPGDLTATDIVSLERELALKLPPA